MKKNSLKSNFAQNFLDYKQFKIAAKNVVIKYPESGGRVNKR